MAFAATALLPYAARPASAPSDRALEHEIKAEFVERFTRFVEWPTDAFADGEAPFVACVAGTGALAHRLRGVLAAGRRAGRPTLVRPLSDGDPVGGCHLIFVSGSERDRVEALLRLTRDRPILTIGDTPGFASLGVLINLFVDGDGFVRFEINREAAAMSGLRFSARLLSLARIVPGGG